MADGKQPTEPTVVHYVHSTHSGSTLYHKETVGGETVIKEYTVISLRCRRKDKQRAEEEERRRQSSRKLSGGGEGGEETSRSPQKRQREERIDEEPSVVSAPPRKKNRQDRDSGCESDSGSPTTTGLGSLDMEVPVEPCSVVPEERSSGVGSEDSCPETTTSHCHGFC